MKRKVSVFLTLVMCLSLCACGQGKSSTSDSTPNSSAVSGTTATKGTKKDPYKLGEEIKFSTCDLSEENRFDVTLTIKELSAEERKAVIELVKTMNANGWLRKADIMWCKENNIPIL